MPGLFFAFFFKKYAKKLIPTPFLLNIESDGMDVCIP